MIEYHNPEAKIGVESIPYERTIRLRGSNDVGVGFLANGFPDSVNFLHELGAAMRELEPGIAVFSYNKGNASVPASEELLNSIKGECQAVIAAYGH